MLEREIKQVFPSGSKILEDQHNINARVCILGHIQRGGAPTHQDRFISAKMANFAVKNLLENPKTSAIVYRQGKVMSTALSECFDTKIDYENLTLNLLELFNLRELFIIYTMLIDFTAHELEVYSFEYYLLRSSLIRFFNLLNNLLYLLYIARKSKLSIFFEHSESDTTKAIDIFFGAKNL